MKSIYIILIMMISLFSSCKEEIKLDLNSSEPELVVEGAITSDTTAHKITLKKTAAYFANEATKRISGAIVKLSDGYNEITLKEDAFEKGSYLTPVDYYGKTGRNYTLDISNVDINGDGVFEKYTSSCVLNSVPAIDSMSVIEKKIFYHRAFAIRISMQEPANEQNYYLFRSYTNGVCTSDSINEWGITDDEFFNGVHLNNESVMYLFPTEKTDEDLHDNDKVMIEMCGITKDYMNFINEVQEEYQGRNPLFGGQPANIRTNIVRTYPQSTDGKGARGYFAAYAVTRKQTIYHPSATNN